MIWTFLLIPWTALIIVLSTISFDCSAKIINRTKICALIFCLINLLLGFIIYIKSDFSTIVFQFVEKFRDVSPFDIFLGLDFISLFFLLLTSLIIPISLLSNWNSIGLNIRSYIIILIILEALLLAVFLMLDILLYYIFFESILAPLFLIIGLFGSDDRVRAGFYLFLYTLLGSLFLLISILSISSLLGSSDYNALFKTNIEIITQIFLFYGIFIAFAVKTPTVFLNSWLLKAHVESPLSASIILAAIVLKLSLYGIFRLILPMLPKACIDYTFIVYIIGVITIIYASISTLRTIDIKELIAYSSVSHAAVYLMAVFSNTIQGLEGAIILGLAHGLTSSGLFICVGGILYDRAHTRIINFYRGLAQLMPLFSLLFYLLCLSNCATPLTLNFIGEFLSLYGIFEKLPLLGVISSSSIIFSAAFSIYMFNKIVFAGSYSRFFIFFIPDITKREFILLLTLLIFILFLGLYPCCLLDGLHYSVSNLIFNTDFIIYCIDDDIKTITEGVKDKSDLEDKKKDIDDDDIKTIKGVKKVKVHKKIIDDVDELDSDSDLDLPTLRWKNQPVAPEFDFGPSPSDIEGAKKYKEYQELKAKQLEEQDTKQKTQLLKEQLKYNQHKYLQDKANWAESWDPLESEEQDYFHAMQRENLQQIESKLSVLKTEKHDIEKGDRYQTEKGYIQYDVPEHSKVEKLDKRIANLELQKEEVINNMNTSYYQEWYNKQKKDE